MLQCMHFCELCGVTRSIIYGKNIWISFAFIYGKEKAKSVMVVIYVKDLIKKMYLYPQCKIFVIEGYYRKYHY